jgi:Zn-dependent protease with chaperone function
MSSDSFAGALPTAAPPAVERAWIDPRRWATLVRAYALFLAVAALSVYNDTWDLILKRWMVTPAEDATSGVWLQPMKVALFLLPFIASQLFTAVWLLLVRARRPEDSNRAYRITREVLDEVRRARGFRRVRVVVAAVAQPHLVSVLGKPFLVLPRQGLRYFEQHVRADPEQSFRAVIAHEAGHLESWDDLLFLPTFSYIAASLLLCLFGAVQAIGGKMAFSAVLAQVLAIGALAVLATYVVRRREAYADSFSVVTLRSVDATTNALAALRREAAATRSRLNTHFDVHSRLALLARRGRPFLELTRYDLALVAFIYFNLGKPSVSDVAAGAGAVWVLTSWFDTLTHFVLIWLFVLLVAGAALARRGEPMPTRDLVIAAVLALGSRAVFGFIGTGVFTVIQGMSALATFFGSLLLSGVPFLLVMAVLNRWAVAILGRPGRDARERLVWGALWIATVFTALRMLFMLAASGFAARAASSIEDVAGGSTEQQVAFMLPLFLMVLGMATVTLAAALWIAIWSWRRSRSIPDVRCPACGMTFFPKTARYPVALSCPRCEAILRHDLVVQFEPAGAAS